MALSSRFVFINGPSLVSIESREDRRWLRSRVIRRAYREHEKQKSRVARHERAKEQKFALDCVGNQLTSQAGLPGRRLLPARVIGTQDPACTTCYGSFHSSPREKTSSSTCSSYSIPTHISSIEFFASIDSRYNELIHYCINVLWPGFRLFGDYALHSYHAWIPRAASTSYVLHALLLCASTHSASMRGHPRKLELEKLHHRGEALKSIREVISTGAKDYDVECLLLATLFLAMNNDEYFEEYREPDPFIAPLANMQWLSHYSGCQMHPFHWNAIQVLVRQHGGIGNLTTFALPWLLSYASLIQAAITMSKPVYSLFEPDGKPYAYIPPTKLFQTNQSQTLECGRGFRYLQSIGIRADVVQTFVDLGQLSQIIQQLGETIYESPTIDMIGDCRNSVQHRLHSLPPTAALADRFTPLESSTVSFHQILSLYETCRVAALLFSTSVTFPVSRTPRQREEILANLQKHILIVSQQTCEDDEILGLLLWCAVVGGISAEHSPMRRWYAAQVSKLSIAYGVQNWHDMKELMNQFAWLDIACEAGGLTLWNEINGTFESRSEV